ncbi:MAG: CHAT domain-containing protein [Bacteroidales bacterium]|nr:CHAT domain-containing protein [Bacteroidales bacterium]
MNRLFAIFLLLLALGMKGVAQRVDKSKFWPVVTDSLFRNELRKVAKGAPDQLYDSLATVIGQRAANLETTETAGHFLSLVQKLDREGRSGKAFDLTNQAIDVVRKNGDTLHFPYSQLMFTKANLLRDQGKMEKALAPALNEISVLRANDTLHPALLDAYTNLISNYFAMRQTRAGMAYTGEVIRLAHKLQFPFYEINTYRLMGDIIKFYQPPLGLECMRFANWLSESYTTSNLESDPYYCISMGSAWVATDHPDSALLWFQKGLAAVRSLPGNQSRAIGFLYYYMGVSHKNLFDYAPAVAYIDSALRIEEQNNTANSESYFRSLHQKGKMLNKLNRYDEALVVNKTVLDNTTQRVPAFYSNAVEQYGRSLMGTGQLNEALLLIHRHICQLTATPDTLPPLATPQYNKKVTAQSDLRELTFVLGLKNEIVAALFQVDPLNEYREAIIQNMHYLLQVIDMEASVAQTPDGFLDLARRYRMFADQVVDFFSNQKETASQELLQRIYPLVARSKAYSVICRSYALGTSGDSVFDASSVRLNQVAEMLLQTNSQSNTSLYRELKTEEIGLLVKRYIQSLDKRKTTAQLMVPQMLPDENTRPGMGLQPGELLLDYYSTPQNLVRFTISNNSFDACFQPLPADFNDQCNKLARAVKTGDEPATASASGYLSELLFNQLPHAPHNEKFTIIPDENLYYIPFEMLRLHHEKQPLVMKHTVAYRYTSHLYRIEETKQGENTLAAFAPMTNDGTTPLVSTGIRSNEVRESGGDSLLNRGGNAFAALPWSLEEVNDVAALFRAKGLPVQVFTGKQARKSSFRQWAGGASIVHVATHGLVNKRNPEKSGLVFATDTTSNTDPLLYMGEMFGMKANPSLMVLSACKTGVGVLEKGEGIMALPRGLLVAGVQNVVASLWNVNDQATRPLMVGFYRHLLNGDDYATALQKSKKECIANGFMPIDWAGFVLIER